MANQIDILDDNYCELSNKTKDLTNKQFNNWLVLGYKGNQSWLCECQCEKHTKKIVRAYDLVNGLSRSCGCTRHEDLTGQKFGNWIVKRYAGDQKWLCECQCENHTLKEVRATYLKNGTSKSCGCLQKKLAAEHMRNIATSRRKDIKGNIIGNWKALDYVGEGNWRFQCLTCGDIIECRERDIKSGRKCRKCTHPSTFKDLTGQMINNWKVLKYAGNKSWVCECQCEKHTIKTIRTSRLLSGDSKSCGCKNYYYSLKTFGYTDEQIEVIINKEKFIEFIKQFSNKPTLYDIAKKLDVNYQIVVRRINELGLREYIDYNYNNSHLEKEVYDWLKDELHLNVISSDRTVLNGLELDMYIPDKKLAIEFNGDYWHSSVHKDKYYHQNKTIDCAKKGIQLIHIFEHEWICHETQRKIKDIIQNSVGYNQCLNIYARKTVVTEIKMEDAKEFLNKYHLQMYCKSSIYIGCMYDNKLIGVLTFGKPRFNSNYQYELIRLCWHPDYKVTGGTEKMFNYFVSNYKPESIVTYSDISKFTGNVYLRLGFKPIDPMITEPNYIWIDSKLENILTRYETMKHKLVNSGLGTEEQTEDEIMESHGYMKIYDCGNIKLDWRKRNA